MRETRTGFGAKGGAAQGKKEFKAEGGLQPDDDDEEDEDVGEDEEDDEEGGEGVDVEDDEEDEAEVEDVAATGRGGAALRDVISIKNAEVAERSSGRGHKQRVKDPVPNRGCPERFQRGSSRT